jgi:hypothetical protein
MLHMNALDTRLEEIIWHIEQDLVLGNPDDFTFPTRTDAIEAIKEAFITNSWIGPQ